MPVPPGSYSASNFAGAAGSVIEVTLMNKGSLEGPTLAVGIRQKAAEFAAMRTPARDGVRPCPIAWRLQRFGDTRAQVLEGRRAQALHRGHVLMRRPPG